MKNKILLILFVFLTLGFTNSSYGMRIQVRCFAPNHVFLQDIQCDPSWTVEMVKRSVQDAQGISTDQQRFVYAGQQMEDGQTLSSYNVQDGSTIHLIIRTIRATPQSLPNDSLFDYVIDYFKHLLSYIC